MTSGDSGQRNQTTVLWLLAVLVDGRTELDQTACIIHVKPSNPSSIIFPLAQVLFDGRTELDQISRIFNLLGSPNEKIWPGLAKLPNASKVRARTASPLLLSAGTHSKPA